MGKNKGRKGQSIPIKVSVSVCWSSKKNKHVIYWTDLDTRKRKSINVPDGCDFLEESEKLRSKLENKLLDGKYDTYEARLRKYISEVERLEEARANGLRIVTDHKGGSTRQIAAGSVHISSNVVKHGLPVIKAIDEMYKNGDAHNARKLAHVLNRSPIQAYKELDEKYKNTSPERIDITITTMLGTLARRFDERHDIKGNSEYRDDCMVALKMLYKKYDEWRASE